MTGPSMSTHTPVSMGSVSSRLADGTTWAAAAASTPPSTVPEAAGGSGRPGYSSTGRATSSNSALPQLQPDHVGLGADLDQAAAAGCG